MGPNPDSRVDSVKMKAGIIGELLAANNESKLI